MAQRLTPEPEADAAPEAAPAQKHLRSPHTLTVVWMHEGPVCVSVVDSPAPQTGGGVCHCPACHAAQVADWAEKFY